MLKPYYEELLVKQMELSRRYQKTLLDEAWEKSREI